MGLAMYIVVVHDSPISGDGNSRERERVLDCS